MVRHLRSFVHDLLDVVLEYDSRLWRSLIPLYFSPGRITRQFLAGKRIRFVLPFRLFFVITVVSLLVVQLVVDPIVTGGPAAVLAIEQADSVEDVERLKTEALARLNEERQSPGDAQGTAAAKQLVIRKAADARSQWLEAAAKARAEGRPPPPAQAVTGVVIDGQHWDPQAHPLRIDWLPDSVNGRINAWLVRADKNIRRGVQEPGWLVDSILGRLPAALFVLVPIFALLLTVFYLGKRWLYTAHLVVALHSHSFLALALMVSVLLGGLERAVHGVTWLAMPVGLAVNASQLWMPVYLLLMQRRVYAQSWPVTVLKFALIGTIYTVLLFVTGLAVAAISLVVS